MPTTRKTRTTRRKHTTPRVRQQRGGATDEQIGTVVHTHFPELHGEVTNGHVRLFCQGAESGQGPTSDPIQFEIAAPLMILHSLKKCPTITGTTILQRIIAIGRALSLDRIDLDDASMVGCHYPLYTLSILQHGETWYHRMGFRSDDYETNKALHEALRRQPFQRFVLHMFRVHERRTNQSARRIRLQRSHAFLQTWYDAFPETRGHTVAEVAQMLPWTTLPCDHPHAALLRDFLFMADSALPYEPYVSLDLRAM